MIIDSHHHLWRLSRGDYGWLTPDLAALYRDFEPGDLTPLMAANGIAGGILVQAPRLGWILGFCVMASLGLPGLAGFWGEFPAILSAYDPAKLTQGLVNGDPLLTFRVFMVIAAIGTVLAAGYLLWMFQRVAFGTVKAEFEHSHIHDVHIPEWIAWVPLKRLIASIRCRGPLPRRALRSCCTA